MNRGQQTDRNGAPMARRNPTPMRLVIDGRDITDHVIELHYDAKDGHRAVTAVFEHPDVTIDHEDQALVFAVGQSAPKEA